MSHLEKAESGTAGTDHTVPSLVNANTPYRVPSKRLGNPAPLYVAISRI